MRLLLDTCTFLWIIAGAAELSKHARELFADPANETYLSAVSGLGDCRQARARTPAAAPLPQPPPRYIPLQRQQHGIEPLPLDEESALHIARLPILH